MTDEQKAAVINARVACATIRALGMTAENKQREIRGESMAYVEEDFERVINEEGIHWNSIHSVIFGG